MLVCMCENTMDISSPIIVLYDMTMVL